MGFWFFLSVIVAGNMVLKAYKLRIATKGYQDRRLKALESEMFQMREKIQHLDEAVFLGDFELKRQFRDLEQNSSFKQG